MRIPEDTKVFLYLGSHYIEINRIVYCRYGNRNTYTWKKSIIEDITMEFIKNSPQPYAKYLGIFSDVYKNQLVEKDTNIFKLPFLWKRL